MKLIDDARHAWRLWSVRLPAIGAAALGLVLASPDFALTLWNMLPSDVRALLPDRLALVIGLLLFGATIVARIIKQRRPNDAR